MIHHAVVQGSEEWLRLRLGKPTASEFERLITPAEKRDPKTGEIKGWQPTRGETRRNYALELVTQLIIDGPLDAPTTPAMIHGTSWEEKAKRAYEMLTGVDVEDCGFCTTDDGMVGASPDAFVTEDGSLEIKCPHKPNIHVGYLLKPETLQEEFWVQVQGQLYVTGRKWTDLISYFMGIPMVQVRITPHQEFQARLAASLKQFLCELTDMIQVAKDRGVVFRERKPAEPQLPHKDWLTQQDVEDIIAARFPNG